jgi:transposase
MLYLGIDQHSKQLTVNVRNEQGEVVERKQVSTKGAAPREFLRRLAESAGESGYAAIVEVCGFNDWLLELLPQCGCVETVLVQSDKRAKRKTDRRDANQLSELLWLNRLRLQNKQRIQGLRRVNIPTPQERADRRLAALRHRAGRELTRVINRMRNLLRRLNLQHDCPTKSIRAKKARAWLKQLSLSPLDRLELDQLMAREELLEQQLESLEESLVPRVQHSEDARLLRTLPHAGNFMAVGLAAHVGDIARFPRPRSLANYWGLTPGCHNSGESGSRLGSITKQGSTLARFLLGQLVMHVLRQDGKLRAWYVNVKRRRGAKIARVAVMRRLATIIWHMLTHREAYMRGGKRRLAGAPAQDLGALPPDPRDLSPEVQSRGVGRKKGKRAPADALPSASDTAAALGLLPSRALSSAR